MQQMLRWVPDQENCLLPLGTWRLGDVRKTFAMGPLILAHFCCVWGGMTRSERDAWLGAESYPAALLNCLSTVREAMPPAERSWPSPHTVAIHLLRGSEPSLR